MESLFIHLILKMDPYDWFCGPGSHIYIYVYGSYSLHNVYTCTIVHSEYIYVYSLKCFVFRQYTQHWNESNHMFFLVSLFILIQKDTRNKNN